MKTAILTIFIVAISLQVRAEDEFAGPITEQAKTWGLTKCINAINTLDKNLNENAGSNGAWAFAECESLH